MSKPISISKHAFYRLQMRGITEHEIEYVVHNGLVIEEYPEDKPYPSRLIYGCIQGKHLHVVAAYDTIRDKEIAITTYEPDPADWQDGFVKRKTL